MNTLSTSRRFRNNKLKFDIALSFAEEDRPFVDKVARYLKEKNLRVFYDKDEMIDSWGKDLYVHLDEIYREKARFCVLFISRHYKQKRWTTHERIRAQARSFFSRHGDYILPFRFDDTEIEGVQEGMVYLSSKEYDERRLAEAIFDKIERNKTYGQRLRQRFLPFVTRKAAVTSLLGMAAGIGFSLLPDRLIPVEELAKNLRERSLERIRGAVCRDSTFSSSTGRGTCSHHGGIAYYLDTAIYHKTWKESLEEARQKTWRSR